MVRLLLSVVLVLIGTYAAAQGPNGVFLIAKPDLDDPNFRQTVVLVTQAEDYRTVGVVINRPGKRKLADIVSEDIDASAYKDDVYIGGPIMLRTLVAVFTAESAPLAPAFQVLRSLYMSMHPDNVKQLLASEGRRYRLYAGFSGWAPMQLKGEFDGEGWYVLPADADMVFRRDTSGLWDELIERVRARKTRAPGMEISPGFLLSTARVEKNLSLGPEAVGAWW